MPRYVVERSFPQGLDSPATPEGADRCRRRGRPQRRGAVTWLHSYVSADGKSTFCVYDAPSPESIRTAAARNRLPVDRITQVRVLDPLLQRMRRAPDEGSTVDGEERCGNRARRGGRRVDRGGGAVRRGRAPDPCADAARPPLPGAKYGSFGAGCHYVDGTFVPSQSQDACPKTDPQTGAAFSFWHPLLITMHVWLWYPNPSGLYASTNPLVSAYNGG